MENTTEEYLSEHVGSSFSNLSNDLLQVNHIDDKLL